MSYDFRNNKLNTVFTGCLLLVFFTLTWVIIQKNNSVLKNDLDLDVLPKKEYTIQDALDSIKEDDCKRTMNYLASDDLEGRMSGKKGNILAAEYIKNELEKYGIKTVYKRFEIKSANSGPKKEQGDNYTQNVYGYIIGESIPNEVVVLGAHFDHIGYGPRYSRSKKNRNTQWRRR